MASNTRTFISCAEEDRISNLPENLIDSVLEHLPIQDAVKTSILSRKWRYRWTTLRLLVFDEHFSKKFGKYQAFCHKGLIRIINQVFIFHKGPILKFHLHIPEMHLDSFQEIDQWMFFLSRNGVKELVLTNSNRRYELPSYLFSCLDLIKLRLENCIFKPPREHGGFLNLEDLVLRNIIFGANFSGLPVALPHLRSLQLFSCTGVCNLNIKATKLHTLLVIGCHDAKLLQFFANPYLTVVGTCFLESVEDIIKAEIMTLAKLLSSLPRIQLLIMDGYFLKFLATEGIPKTLPHAINSLRAVTLLCFKLVDLDQLCGALCLLQSSPNLESFRILNSQIVDYDVGPALNHLEAPDCFDRTLNRLRHVDITSVEGSRPELLFIKLLLARSSSLEKLILRPSGTCDTYKRLEIARDVMRFPRASRNAEMIYEDLTS